MSHKEKIKRFQEEAMNQIDHVYENLVFPKLFFDATQQQKSIRQLIDKTEYKKFDEDWIVKIESFFPSLNQIIANIRNTLKYEEEILPIERTRRTSNVSIRHILRNTKYIQDINEDNEVYPSKVLNTISEIDYGIYENKFIMTLIDRLYHYLHRRIDAIHEHIHGFKQSHFTFKNEFKIGQANYNLNFELNAKETFNSSEIDLHNRRILERTQAAFKVVSRMYHSDFMRTMSRYKKVSPPILKTQMIQKNADFRNAYTLWLYLDRLNILDYKLQLETSDKTFDHDYLQQIDKGLMVLFSTLFVNSDLGRSIFEEKTLQLESIEPTKPDISQYVTNLNVTIPPIELESVIASEYHLEKGRQLLSRKELANIQIDNNPENTNYLKQVLLDQYSIADQIFNAYLKLDMDDDVFGKLLTYKHPVKKYEEALNKYFITKAARQVKEKLFQESLALEQKWLKQLEVLQEQALESIIRSGQKHDDELIESMHKQMDKELKLLEKQELQKSKEVIRNQRIKNNQAIKDLTQKHQTEVRLYRQQQNKRLKAEKEKIAQKLALEKKRMKERELLKRKKEREKLMQEKQAKVKAMNQTKTQTKKDIRTKVSDKIKQAKLKK